MGCRGSKAFPEIFDKALHAYELWKRPGLKSICGVDLKYPPYIAYLVLSVLPLIGFAG